MAAAGAGLRMVTAPRARAACEGRGRDGLVDLELADDDIHPLLGRDGLGGVLRQQAPRWRPAR